MANKHVYFGIERLPALSAGQRATLVADLKGLGTANNSSQPAERNHWRTRLDNDAVIFEALFDETNIDIAAMKDFLAITFGVSASSIESNTQATVYGLVVTFSRLGTDYLRSIAFGYDAGWPTWNDSRLAVHVYLAANSAAWNEL